MSNTTQAGAAPSEQPSSPAQSQTTRAETPSETRAQTSVQTPVQTSVQTPPESSVAAAPTSAAGQSTSNPPTSAPTSNPPAQQTSQASPAQTPSSSSAAEQPSSPAATSQQPQQPTSAAAQPTSAAASQPVNSQPSSVNSDSTEAITTVVTVTPTDGTAAQTSIILVTSTILGTASRPSSTIGSSAKSSATPIGPGSGSSGGGLTQKSKVAIGVVVPIAAIAILAIVGLFFWKKRRARQAAQEERRKEVEDYSYNPNADPTIPNVGMGGDGSYEMREDGSSGYRGWGNTTLGSTGRKASTTMSGGVGQAYSDATSPTMRGNMSDAPLMEGSHSPEGEILGAMGPSTASNRGADVHRGPSNASSSYSAAGRSENSDGVGMTYGAGGTYYDQYAQNNPYNENNYTQQGPPSQPIIRDNPARRNTRIESPSHYPQQSAGISQNF